MFFFHIFFQYFRRKLYIDKMNIFRNPWNWLASWKLFSKSGIAVLHNSWYYAPIWWIFWCWKYQQLVSTGTIRWNEHLVSLWLTVLYFHVFHFKKVIFLNCTAFLRFYIYFCVEFDYTRKINNSKIISIFMRNYEQIAQYHFQTTIDSSVKCYFRNNKVKEAHICNRLFHVFIQGESRNASIDCGKSG